MVQSGLQARSGTNDGCDGLSMISLGRRKRMSARANATEPPQRLGWSSAYWAQHGSAWYARMNELLDVEAYLQECFKANERVRSAEAELLAANDGGDASTIALPESRSSFSE